MNTMAAQYHEREKELERKMKDADCALFDFLEQFKNLGDTGREKLKALAEIASVHGRIDNTNL